MSLKDKQFKVGDLVYHVSYERYGRIVEDTSNEYAETYKVRDGGNLLTASAGLLVSVKVVGKLAELNANFDAVTGKYIITEKIHEIVTPGGINGYVSTSDGCHINKQVIGRVTANRYDSSISVYCYCDEEEVDNQLKKIDKMVAEWTAKKIDDVTRLLKSLEKMATISYTLKKEE